MIREKILSRTWWRVPIGSRTLLVGVHQIFIHPIVVAIAWKRLYGWPLDPRLWAAFVCHDWGYAGCRDLDGDDGEMHPFLGAHLMRRFFGTEWYYFCLLHSRFLAKTLGLPYSRLSVADKLAVRYYPVWLYLALGNLSGEIDEHMKTYAWRALSQAERIEPNDTINYQRDWLRTVTAYLEAWAWEHKDGREDTWTKKGPVPRQLMANDAMKSCDDLS